MSEATLPSGTRELVQLVAQSKALSLDCRRLVEQSRDLIASSRRNLNPFLEIAGSSHDGVRQAIREGLEHGDLFPVDGNGFGARGKRRLCSVCDMPVLPEEMEITITEPRRAHAHASCYAVWLEESKTWRELRKKPVKGRRG